MTEMLDLLVSVLPSDSWQNYSGRISRSLLHESYDIGFVRVGWNVSLTELREKSREQLSDELPLYFHFLRQVGERLIRVTAKQEKLLKVKNYAPPEMRSPEIFLLKDEYGDLFGSRSSSQQFCDRNLLHKAKYPLSPISSPSSSQSTHSIDKRRNIIPSCEHNDHHSTNADDFNHNFRCSKCSKHGLDPINKLPNIYQEKYDYLSARDSDINSLKDNIRSSHVFTGRYSSSENIDNNHYNEGMSSSSASSSSIQKEAQTTCRKEDDQNEKILEYSDKSKKKDRQKKASSRSSSDNSKEAHIQFREEEDQNEESLKFNDQSKQNDIQIKETSRSSSDDKKEAQAQFREVHDLKQIDSKDTLKSVDLIGEDNISSNNSRESVHDGSKQISSKDALKFNETIGKENIAPNDSKEPVNSISTRISNDSKNSYRSSDSNEKESNHSAKSGSKEMKSEIDSPRDLDNTKCLIKEMRNSRERLGKKREELIKKVKSTTLSNKSKDSFKKLYFEEKKKTTPLEEQCNTTRNELESLHKLIMGNLENNKIDKNGKIEKPSMKSNLKLNATKLIHEIDELRRQCSNIKMKLSTEIKLRHQAESELRLNRNDLIQQKISISLERNNDHKINGILM